MIGGTAASAMCKSCNCNSSIATRVGFGVSYLILLHAAGADKVAHLRYVVYAGVLVKDGYRYSAIGEVELGLDQDGLFRWEMLWSTRCKLARPSNRHRAND